MSFTMQDVENTFSRDTKGYQIDITPTTNERFLIKIDGRPKGFMATRKYGVGWTIYHRGDYSTYKIRTEEDLLTTVETVMNQKKMTEAASSVVTPVSVDDTGLVPDMFKYRPRRIDRSTDVVIFEEAMARTENVLLEGPTGSGKTALIRFYCAKHKMPYVRVSLNGGATSEDLVGHYTLKDNETVWVDGLLTKAMRYGWCIVFDEINASPQDVLFVLNPVLDEERTLTLIQKDGEIIKPHPNFRAIATMNPDYAGTKEVSEALYDRFDTILEIDYSEDVESFLVREIIKDTEVQKDIAKFTKAIRDSFIRDEITTPFSTRSVMNLANKVLRNEANLMKYRFKSYERNTVSDILDMYIFKTKPVTEGE